MIDPHVVYQYLRDLIEPSQPLTDWEDEFVESVSQQFENTGLISQKQFDVLERIHGDRS